MDESHEEEEVTKLSEESIPADAVIRRLIYEHPCLPIVKLLQGKCERATNPEHWDEPGLFALDDVNEAIFKLKSANLSPSLDSDDESTPSSSLKKAAEVNEMIHETMVVLRIHLAELHRLSELCETFTHNYREKLKKAFVRKKK